MRSRPRRPGTALLAVTLASTAAVVVWLLVWPDAPLVTGAVFGPVACLAAALACRRIGVDAGLPRPLRVFWRRMSHAAGFLVLSGVTDLIAAPEQPEVAAYTAAPMILCTVMVSLAFLQLPLGRRSTLNVFEVLLDGAIVAIGGALMMFVVVLGHADAAVDRVTQVGSALGAVGALIAVVVIGKAAVAPSGPIDPAALRVLTVAPVFGLASAVLSVVGDHSARLAVYMLAIPVMGLAFCASAYRQQAVLVTRAPRPPVPGRSLFTLLPWVAVTVTAALLGMISFRELSWEHSLIITGAVLIAAFVVLRQLIGLYDVRRKQADLVDLAMRDKLTGLASRARFGQELAERLDAHQSAAVLLIDLDDFKSVNVAMGHAVGDRLLVEVGLRLRSVPSDLTARLGGDEFAVLLGSLGAAEQAAELVLELLAAPFEVGDDLLLAHASVGVALAGPGESADDVLRDADTAMYAAKDNGKACWARFEPEMRSEAVNHAVLGSELHRAIDNGELFLLYQPVWDTATGRMAGAEALVRWRHPSRGLVSPGEFIPVAERSGLIVQLGAWALREACGQLARWHADLGDAAIRSVNVNVAGRQLSDPGFVGEVVAALADAGLSPENLVLEVTETAVIEGRVVREALDALHDMGVRLALDDFGTGQSSLSLLRAFPVDVVKLDKSFVDGITEGADKGRLAVAAAVAQLAEHLQLTAVAEGIETEEQAARLTAMGYQRGQGFLYARPLSPDEAAAKMAGEFALS